MSVPISVRFDENVNKFLTHVVKEKNTTKTDFIRQAVMEKLEDLYDIEMADKSYKKWLEDDKKTFSHKEAMKRYG
ncbi:MULTISPECIES: type II toxin-antitoxin system RelB family antitoxin [unclassified Gemella]|uniref:type II toxin-antitoxin system RelB family antitoxin n=1 Tax=unclassified Gemella TaxID=2624949 RepID=UPI001C04F30A|nr:MULTISPECIES: DUF6290 family protein [unclassified Gemella]MBU0278187.1 hypothetical protein [Gemella sp. zg-1178]QWQ38855.1 hypothetical protein KMP11_00365 [Gemella sp. zg-570]